MIKLKNLINEAAIKETVMREEDFEFEMQRGYKMGKKDAAAEYERDLENLPPAFVKGYKKGYREERRRRWWDSMNAKMTDLLGRMGSSRLR